jgi:dual specificity tyrosine-phosphorylation-regulated kinase 2/3/4
MSFRGISSITGSYGSASTRNSTDGPFTLPRKGFGATRPSAGPPLPRGVSQDASNPTQSTGGFGAMLFTPRPPVQPPTSSNVTIGQLSGRIMSATASRPGTGGQRPVQPARSFGLDLASLLANLDVSGQSPRQATQAPSEQQHQQPMVSLDTQGSASKARQVVPQLPPSARLGSAGRFMPVQAQQVSRPIVEETQLASTEQKPMVPLQPDRIEMALQVKSSAKEDAPVPTDGSRGKMTPSEALEIYDRFLSRYERREILEYDEVYFLGIAATKIDAPVTDGANFGYDDERGDYCVVKGDHIAFRYEVVGELGKGSFGQVLKVQDHKKGTQCALKIIRNKKRFHQQATVEIRILDHLRSRDPEDRSCTVRMLNYFKFRSHTIITFEMHSMNLYELAKLNKYQPFAPALIKRFTAQILVAMSFMWREQIVHCDLKPENILLRYENKTSIKIIDFGSSCFESERIYTYIQSRFYRAPEIVLGLPYGRPIDLWSLGCIVCEMQMGYPIFPGESEKEQLLCVMEILGVPPPRMVDRSPRKKDFFETNGSPKIFANSRNRIRKPATKDIMKTLRTEDSSFVDFVLSFLQWEPAERMTPNEAMRHPWIAECFQQDTVQPQSSASGPPRPRLNSARPQHSQPTAPTAAQGLPSIEANAQPSVKGVAAWRLANRKIGSAQTQRLHPTS